MSKFARALNLRDGEGRTLGVMAAFLFLNTANTTVISAAKNGLFLSAYPGELIPWAIIAAALLTAVAAIVFAGIISGTGRRALAVGLTIVLGASLVGSRILFQVDARSAFVLYLWLSAVQVLIVTHSWTYVGGLAARGRRGAIQARAKGKGRATNGGGKRVPSVWGGVEEVIAS